MYDGAAFRFGLSSIAAPSPTKNKRIIFQTWKKHIKL